MIICGLDPSLTNTGIAILKDGQILDLSNEIRNGRHAKARNHGRSI